MGAASVTCESERSRFGVAWNAMGIQGGAGALVAFQMRWGESGDVYVAYEAVTTTTTTSARVRRLTRETGEMREDRGNAALRLDWSVSASLLSILVACLLGESSRVCNCVTTECPP
eukprot:GHVU01137432.1.p1 GENE.GHVU01137432.1~~GHVU01137432.1.p1  ORF type:complete len:124 (-),score=17.86 GHVU01137432.1:281-628(-)